MQKLSETPDRKTSDTYAKKKELSRQKKKTVFFQR